MVIHEISRTERKFALNQNAVYFFIQIKLIQFLNSMIQRTTKIAYLGVLEF